MRYLFLYIVFLLQFFVLISHAQEKKEESKIHTLTNGKVSRKIIGSLIHTNDTTMEQRSEMAFMSYQGKIIRHIAIERIGFERSIYDTTRKKIINNAVRIANDMHKDTRQQTIRNNLFFHENKPLNPYKLADNERYLRDLDFILDARIVVIPGQSTDSVDVAVTTRDIFSFGGSFTPSSTARYKLRLYDANLAGIGQRTQVRVLYDPDRDADIGYQLLYAKNSLAGSLINATISYTQLDNGASYGLENENAFYVRFDRPLVSAYTRWAGGLELSENWSVNVYNKPDTSYRSYRYDIQDFWTGYNFGIKNQMRNRNRQFLALRTFNQHFGERPTQRIERTNPIYNGQRYLLAGLTLFNQNFYKTKYIYGFGRTEDVPFGEQLTFLVGRASQLNLNRTYYGVDAEKSVVRKNGDFHLYSLRAEGFFEKKGFQDVTILGSLSYFSKIIPFKNLKIRQSVSAVYTSIINQTTALPLQINNEFGLKRFLADSLLGNKRLSIHTETVAFTAGSLLGFRFAPLVFAEMAMIAPEHAGLFKQQAYFSLGAGLRTRNENLVFGTIELRMFYFPRVTEDLSHFKVSVSSNLQVKYSSGFVKAPSFIRYN